MDAAEIAVVLWISVALCVKNAICKATAAQQRLPMNSSQQLPVLSNNAWLRGQCIANLQPWADISMETNVLSGKEKGVLR